MARYKLTVVGHIDIEADNPKQALSDAKDVIARIVVIPPNLTNIYDVGPVVIGLSDDVKEADPISGTGR